MDAFLDNSHPKKQFIQTKKDQLKNRPYLSYFIFSRRFKILHTHRHEPWQRPYRWGHSYS